MSSCTDHSCKRSQPILVSFVQAYLDASLGKVGKKSLVKIILRNLCLCSMEMSNTAQLLQIQELLYLHFYFVMSFFTYVNVK